MVSLRKLTIKIFTLFSLFLTISALRADVDTARKINAIIIQGNKYVSTQAILNYVPFKVGEIFNKRKTRQLIRNLYYNLKRFRNVKVQGEHIGDELINVYVIVEEKKLLKDIIFTGNKAISNKTIKEKIDFDAIQTIDKEELTVFAQAIKKLYLEKGYNDIKIKTDLKIKGHQATAYFDIKEGKKAIIKQIRFIGNHSVSSKDLREKIYSKEDWLLGFLDGSGSYHPEKVEGDKHAIEQYYQNNGFLNTRVVDVERVINPETKHINLTYEIKEGPKYTIDEVRAPGNDIASEQALLANVFVRPGQLYSREAIVESIKQLERVWGNSGYIFAHIEPAIRADEEKHTVSITFNSDIGNRVYLNRVTVKGNRKTRDKIIRRKVLLEEGSLLTNYGMDHSKSLIQGLGFFDQKDGVNWKTRRVDDETADLDLIVKEAKTGHFHLKMGFGGAGIMQNPNAGVSVGGELADINLFGQGINLKVAGNWAKNQQDIAFHLGQPWLFDKPISGAIDAYHQRPSYDAFRNAAPIHESLSGGAGTLGFIIVTKHFSPIHALATLGIDNVKYENPATAIGLRDQTQLEEMQCILDKEFAPGKFWWISAALSQDLINHPIHPSHGHRWKLTTKFAFPASCKTELGFYHVDLEFNWFTPLINTYDLVFRLHGFIGFSAPFKNKTIPYRELFHVGGPATVRGFLFSQIGPKLFGNPIGAKKAMFINAELIFPITPDMNMKGILFYDGGAGWDAPYSECVGCDSVRDNGFNYRHSVGFGIRIYNPMPVKVDWGFKLDRRANRFNPQLGESGSEVHFGMSYDW